MLCCIFINGILLTRLFNWCELHSKTFFASRMGKKEISKHFYIPRAACERTITGWAADWHTIFHQPHVAFFDFISMNNEHENMKERKKFSTFTCKRTGTDATEALSCEWRENLFMFVNELAKWTPKISSVKLPVLKVATIRINWNLNTHCQTDAPSELCHVCRHVIQKWPKCFM